MKLDLFYEGRPFTVDFTYSPGKRGRTYGDPGECYPNEPPEVDWELQWFKSEEAIVRMVYPGRWMGGFTEDYAAWVKYEADRLREMIADAIIKEVE